MSGFKVSAAAMTLHLIDQINAVLVQNTFKKVIVQSLDMLVAGQTLVDH